MNYGNAVKFGDCPRNGEFSEKLKVKSEKLFAFRYYFFYWISPEPLQFS